MMIINDAVGDDDDDNDYQLVEDLIFIRITNASIPHNCPAINIPGVPI